MSKGRYWQVWFAGSHSDVGGGYPVDKYGASAADIPLLWMINEAQQYTNLSHMQYENLNKPQHNRSRHSAYRLRGKDVRPIDDSAGMTIHSSVKERWDRDSSYRPENLKAYLDEFGW